MDLDLLLKLCSKASLEILLFRFSGKKAWASEMDYDVTERFGSRPRSSFESLSMATFSSR